MSKDQPRVSIGMPVYNGENFLKESLDSILAQTFEDFELIISDNASTDRTEGICREYAAKDQRIRYYRNEQNLGGAGNHNRVFELSNGEYFKWAHHDDLCAPEFLERCVEELDRRPSVVVSYSKAVIIDEQGKQVAKLPKDLDLNSPKPHERFRRYHDCFRSLSRGELRWWLWNPQSGVIRASALKITPLMGKYISSDTILLEELALLGEFSEVQEYLFFRREHAQGSVYANPTSEQRFLWFNPMKKGRLLFPQWRLFLERFIVINRVQMSWDEKLRCHVEMGRYFRWKWKQLVKDLMINFARFLNIDPMDLWGIKKYVSPGW